MIWPFTWFAKQNEKAFLRFKHKNDNLPNFGSEKLCDKCGSHDLVRIYNDGWFADELLSPPFMMVTCKSCGFWFGEKTLEDSHP